LAHLDRVGVTTTGKKVCQEVLLSRRFEAWRPRANAFSPGGAQLDAPPEPLFPRLPRGSSLRFSKRAKQYNPVRVTLNSTSSVDLFLILMRRAPSSRSMNSAAPCIAKSLKQSRVDL